MLARQRMPTRAFFVRVGQHRGLQGGQVPVVKVARGLTRHMKGGEGDGKTCGVQASIQ